MYVSKLYLCVEDVVNIVYITYVYNIIIINRYILCLS